MSDKCWCEKYLDSCLKNYIDYCYIKKICVRNQYFWLNSSVTVKSFMCFNAGQTHQLQYEWILRIICIKLGLALGFSNFSFSWWIWQWEIFANRKSKWSDLDIKFAFKLTSQLSFGHIADEPELTLILSYW